MGVYSLTWTTADCGSGTWFTLGIRIEAERPDDAAAMLKVHRTAVHGTSSAFHDPAVIANWAPRPIPSKLIASFACELAEGRELAVLARVPDGGVVGFGSIRPFQQDLRALYVEPAFGRRGLGGGSWPCSRRARERTALPSSA